jgi:exoribonuclease R
VDDVLGWRTLPDGTRECMIGIADVAAWIREGDALDVAARAAGQTIYENGVAIRPMLPATISADAASLRADGRPRPILARVFTFPSGAARWSHEYTPIHRAYTYESVTTDAEVCKKIQDDLGAILGRSVGDDPHVWIEEAMILYNRHAAEELRRVRGGLLRAHAGMRDTSYTDIAAASGCAEIAFLGSAAGRYVPSDAAGADAAHAGLGLAAYAHASSPLRRYADLVNQRWVRHLLFEDPEPRVDPQLSEDLNERAKTVKQLERDLWFLTHLKTDAITEVRGVVLKASSRSQAWRVYVPEWRRTVRGTCASPHNPGAAVTIRAYCDLKRPTWDNRIVCQIIS